jgi:hypothetical protein
MTRLILDAAFVRQLAGVTTPIDLCSPEGDTLGRFVPQAARFVPPPEDECPYSPEELARMMSETGGRTLEEIWKKLGQS